MMDLPKAPQDIELKNIIDKLAEFVARNGPDFEQMTKSKQKGNSRFSFLFGGEHYDYYQYKVQSEQSRLHTTGGGVHPTSMPLNSPNAGMNAAGMAVWNMLQQQHQQNTASALSSQQSSAALPHTSIAGTILQQNAGVLQQVSSVLTNAAVLPQVATAVLPAVGSTVLPQRVTVSPLTAFPQGLTIESIKQQQAALQEQTSQSEQNLNAQHVVLLQQQQVSTEELIRKAETENVQKEAEICGINSAEFNAILQPIIDTCTKDSISNGKAWIMQKATSKQATNTLVQYLLLKIMEPDKKFHQRLHIIYLVNDILHHCSRKHITEFMQALENVVVPMFCLTSLGVTEEQQGKLTKLLNIWESKNHYFSDDIVNKLKDPVKSWQEYKDSLITKYPEIVQRLSNQTKTTFQGFQTQHVAFVNHTLQQIQNLEQQKQQLEGIQKQQAAVAQAAAAIASNIPPPPNDRLSRDEDSGDEEGPPGVDRNEFQSGYKDHDKFRDHGDRDDREMFIRDRDNYSRSRDRVDYDRDNDDYSQDSSYEGNRDEYSSRDRDEYGRDRDSRDSFSRDKFHRDIDERDQFIRDRDNFPRSREDKDSYSRDRDDFNRERDRDRNETNRDKDEFRNRDGFNRDSFNDDSNYNRDFNRSDQFDQNSFNDFNNRDNFNSSFRDQFNESRDFNNRTSTDFREFPPPPPPPLPSSNRSSEPFNNNREWSQERMEQPLPAGPPGTTAVFPDLGINLTQPPPGFLFAPPPNIELPDVTRPPPGFPPVLPPQQPDFQPEDLLPSLPYYDLPAGLMIPLVKLDDFKYRSLNPEDIRLPPPAPPSDRLLAAVKLFYTPPGHTHPRDCDGWEKLGLYEYLKAKSDAKKKKEVEIMEGLRDKSRSPTPVRSFYAGEKTPPPKRRYSSRSRSRSRERTTSSRRRNRRDRDRSPRNSAEKTAPPSLLNMPLISPPPGYTESRRTPSPPAFGGAGLGAGSKNEVVEERLSESNKGHQLLRKMGWGGAGLGANEQGIEAPISGGEVREKADQYRGIGININDPYENFRKSKGQAFITRMKARAEERAERSTT